MAEKLGGLTWNIPNDGKVEDISTEYEYYGKNAKEERETYIDPDKVVTRDAQEKIDKIKNKKIGASVADILGIKFTA